MLDIVHTSKSEWYFKHYTFVYCDSCSSYYL